MDTDFILGLPGQPRTSLLRALAERHKGGRTRTVVAWASEGGVERWRQEVLRERIDDVQIVVGCNGGLTELGAILRLQDELAAKVWIAYYNPAELFHHKCYVFDGGSDSAAFSIASGSANLTEGGLMSNAEALLSVNAAGSERAGFRAADQFDQGWATLTAADNPFVHRIKSHDDVKRFYDQGLLATAAEAQRRRQAEAARTEVEEEDGQERKGASSSIPLKPSSRSPRVRFKPLTPPFPVRKRIDARATETSEETSSGQPLSTGREFYVRTLTANDAAKLTNNQTGTFEPDLGEGPRDHNPAFWHWRDGYRRVERKKVRFEYETTARLITALTTDAVIGLRFWFREVREGHAAEHRITPTIGPSGDSIKSYVPKDFDDEGVMVIERAPEGAAHEFIVRLLRPSDPGYDGYRSRAKHKNPRHWWGYGRTGGAGSGAAQTAA